MRISAKDIPSWLKEYIRCHFHYINGELSRDDRKGGLGSLDKYGYLIIKVKGRQIKAHRLVWFLCNGDFPKYEIDHINRVRTDNRIENLRIADRATQILNREHIPNKDTGVYGIAKDKSTKGLRAIYNFHHNGKTYRYRTLEEAVEMRRRIKEA